MPTFSIGFAIIDAPFSQTLSRQCGQLYFRDIKKVSHYTVFYTILYNSQ
jgi:hypothetical protein